jgi:hypothetical protein
VCRPDRKFYSWRVVTDSQSTERCGRSFDDGRKPSRWQLQEIRCHSHDSRVTLTVSLSSLRAGEKTLPEGRKGKKK